MKEADTLEAAQGEAKATLAALRKATWPEQYAMIEALKNHPNPFMDTVLLQLLDWRTSNVREAAMGALLIRNEAFGRVAARALLGDPNWCARNAAAEILGEVGKQQDVQRLRRALADEEWVMRATVADSLGKIGSKSVQAALQDTLERDSNPVVRRDTAYALSYAQRREMIPVLEQALAKENAEQARIGLLQGLMALGQRERLPELLAMLKSEDSQVRYATVNALREDGRAEEKEQIVQAIRAMLEQEEHPGLKVDAEKVIEEIARLTGTD